MFFKFNFWLIKGKLFYFRIYYSIFKSKKGTFSFKVFTIYSLYIQNATQRVKIAHIEFSIYVNIERKKTNRKKINKKPRVKQGQHFHHHAAPDRIYTHIVLCIISAGKIAWAQISIHSLTKTKNMGTFYHINRYLQHTKYPRISHRNFMCFFLPVLSNSMYVYARLRTIAYIISKCIGKTIEKHHCVYWWPEFWVNEKIYNIFSYHFNKTL